MLGADDALDVFGVHARRRDPGRAADRRVRLAEAGRPGHLRLRRRTRSAPTTRSATSSSSRRTGVLHHDRLVRRRRVRRLQDRRPDDRPARDRGRGARRSRHQLARRVRVSDLADGGMTTSATTSGRGFSGRPSGAPFFSRSVPRRRSRRLSAHSSASRRLQSIPACSAPPWFPISPPRSPARCWTSSSASSTGCPTSSAGCARNGRSTRCRSTRRSTCATPASSSRRSTPTSFPGGFNNLNPAFLPLCVQAIQAAVERVCPDARGVLLVPENHTRNTFYLQNVATLQSILRQAGMRVRIGSLLPELDAADDDRAARRRLADARADRAQRARASASRTSIPAWCCSTTTCRPARRRSSRTSTSRSRRRSQAGWYNRRKSHHFAVFHEVAKEFATMLGIDPWLHRSRTSASAARSISRSAPARSASRRTCRPARPDPRKVRGIRHRRRSPS